MSFADIKAGADSPVHVRKTLEAVAFMAPLSAPLPTTLTDASGELQALPPSFVPVGLVTADGYKTSAKVEKSEVEALGYDTPVRTDVTKAPRTVEFEILESGRKFLDELIFGVNLDAVEVGPNGESTFDLPAVPTLREYRLVVVSRDIDQADSSKEWLDAWGFGRVKPASLPDLSFSSKDDARTHALSFDVLADTATKTAMRVWKAGTARKASTTTGYAAAGV